MKAELERLRGSDPQKETTDPVAEPLTDPSSHSKTRPSNIRIPKNPLKH